AAQSERRLPRRAGPRGPAPDHVYLPQRASTGRHAGQRRLARGAALLTAPVAAGRARTHVRCALASTAGNMGTEIIILLIILVVTVILFSIEWFPVDVTALGLIVVLILTGMLTPAEAFSGFGSEVVIMMLGLLIMATATERTGVTQFLAQYLVRWSGNTLNQVLIVVMALTVAVGSFMSNTAATALFLPIVIGLARRLRISQAKLLMPLAFAAILSSSITLIGTSTNIVVSGLMQRYGMEPLGMFELTPAGLPIALAGIAYMYFIGRHLIPDRTRAEQAEGNATGRPRIYLSELHILPGSPFAGKTLAEAALGRDLDLTVLRVVRDKIQYYAPVATLRLQEGDELLVNGMREDILRRSEERRVGKECRSRWSPRREKKKGHAAGTL